MIRSATARAACRLFRARANLAPRHLVATLNGTQSRIPLLRLFSSNPSGDQSSNEETSNEKNAETNLNQDIKDISRQTADSAESSRQEFDFFGEPVTFRKLTTNHRTSNVMAAIDGFLLCAVSKGKTCVFGGDEGGLEAKSAHAAAIAWSEALRYATIWNMRTSVPMISVVVTAPIIAQTGLGYVKHLDSLLNHANPGPPGIPKLSIMVLAEQAVAQKDDEDLNDRERMHLHALDYLLRVDYLSALQQYLRILEKCPGDALALSIAMDISFIVGDKRSALRAAGGVSAYWNERSGGILTPSLPGFPLVLSLTALGFAAGGRFEFAEQLAERAMNTKRSICGGLATWAQAHIFDAGGRVAEGISALANFDGVSNYEGSGFLFFDCRLGGYGARFALDREERGRGKSMALRLYEENFERVLGYSGFGERRPWQQPLRQAPLAWKQSQLIAAGKRLAKKEQKRSLLDRILGRNLPEEEGEKQNLEDYDLIVKRINHPSTELDDWEPAVEDVLTWLPPTPAVISDATLLCLRFTLNGTISPKNARWDNIRNSWYSMFEMQKKHTGDTSALQFCPLWSVTASLLFPPNETGGDKIGNGNLAEGLYEMGKLLDLGNPITDAEKNTALRELIAESSPSFWLPSKSEKEKWIKVVDLLASGIDGSLKDKDGRNSVDASSRFETWDFEARPILEHAVVYAACKSGDIECLTWARAICSQGVTLRVMSPEEWWRYSIVLGLLGDQIGSENAEEASKQTGAGQGAKHGTGRIL